MTRKSQPVGRFLSFALLALAAAMPSSAAPQRSTLGTMEGQVFSTTGFAVEGALVMVQASDGRDPHTTVTNAQGRFRFPMLPTGLYDVRATAHGHSSEWRQNVGVRAGRQTDVALHLQTKKPAPSKAAASLKKR
jgi:Carboxypeptidase regulatory-like domain